MIPAEPGIPASEPHNPDLRFGGCVWGGRAQWLAFTGIGVVITTPLIVLGGGMVMVNVVMVKECLIVLIDLGEVGRAERRSPLTNQ